MTYSLRNCGARLERLNLKGYVYKNVKKIVVQRENEDGYFGIWWWYQPPEKQVRELSEVLVDIVPKPIHLCKNFLNISE